jgi:hypothetical protein
MLSARSAHYWLWFLLFGVVSTLVAFSQSHSLNNIGTEAVWLLVTGLLGIVFGHVRSFARPYDLIVGIIFTGVGLLGVLHNFGINLTAQSPTASQTLADGAILGLSLILPYALIHTVLGLTSLNQGLRAKEATSSVVVNSSQKAA